VETSKTIDQLICDFVAKGVSSHMIHPLDTYYATNRLLNILKKDHFETNLLPSIPLQGLLDLMDQLVQYAVEEGVIEDNSRSREELEAEIMDVVTPAPSVINRTFWESYQEAPMRATDEFYKLSKRNDYIKTRHIAKNEQFKVDSKYGYFDITINLSKPEKSKQEIEEAKLSVGNYPECQLCATNEGYKGRAGISARTNHRVIRIPIQEENWGFQYSPYAYYNEHCIVFSKHHTPMVVNKQTISNLLELVTVLPHYFMGSNAGLPIVGGSLLGHDHYQGGRHHFPMEEAKVLESWDWHADSEVRAERLYWPLSVIRLRAIDPNSLIKAGAEIMEAWSTYSNEALAILSETAGENHNAVTLIARRNGEAYELDVVLRNNRTNDQYPDGIFHPHQDVQHIKKENIGLIEVLGTAILPPRLKSELAEVTQFVLGETDQVADYHLEWANELKEAGNITAETATALIQESVGKKFERVLEDAGVFKQDEAGQEAFAEFVNQFK
jgi:UDPglucose--hexose-1-phosphate uridylyltransferase